MEVENAVSDVVPEYPINAQLGSDLVIKKAMIWITSVMLVKPLVDHACSVDGLLLQPCYHNCRQLPEQLSSAIKLGLATVEWYPVSLGRQLFFA